MILVDSPNVAYPRGVRLELHPPGDYVSDVIRSSGDFYEVDILDEIARRVIGGVLVDVGAMIGNHTAYLQAFVPNDGIHAFEPLPQNAALLWRNALPGQVVVHEVALSDHAGSAAMAYEVGNFGHSYIDTGGRDIRVWPLDHYNLQDVTLLKIDVEGHEAQVLAGASETINRCRPLIVIEDWLGKGYDLPGYRLVAEWETAHQTFMYEAVA